MVDVVGFEIQLARGRHIADEFSFFLLRIFLSSLLYTDFLGKHKFQNSLSLCYNDVSNIYYVPFLELFLFLILFSVFGMKLRMI